jgi:hypothetical protein
VDAPAHKQPHLIAVAEQSSASSKGEPSSETPQLHQAAIWSAVLDEIKTDLETALIRLEVLRQQQHEPAIERAAEMLRSAACELESLPSG